MSYVIVCDECSSIIKNVVESYKFSDEEGRIFYLKLETERGFQAHLCAGCFKRKIIIKGKIAGET